MPDSRRSRPRIEQAVKFKLAFFTLTVRGEDALFGSARGTRARLVLPNGDVRSSRSRTGRRRAALPRGTYKIMLSDGVYRRVAAARPLRAQVAVVPVVTYLDVLSVGGACVVLALGLVLVGRPPILRSAPEPASRSAGARRDHVRPQP